MELKDIMDMIKSGELEKKLDKTEADLQEWLKVIQMLKETIRNFKTSFGGLSGIVEMFKK